MDEYIYLTHPGINGEIVQIFKSDGYGYCFEREIFVSKNEFRTA